MRGLARLGTGRPWWVVIGAIVVLALGIVVGGPLTGSLSAGGFEDPNAEFVAAQDRLAEATGANPDADVIALVTPGGPVDSAEGRAVVARTAGTIQENDAVASIITPFNGGGDTLISRDGDEAYLVVSFSPIDDQAASDAAVELQDAFADDEQVELGGGAVVQDQTSTIISEDLARAELLAFPILFLLSLWVFRGLVAALLPTLMGMLVIFAVFLGLGLIAQATTISVFALNLAIGLSLGLAIDYSLLIVSRYREEIAQRGPGLEALTRTLQTAGKSVFFSAITVAAALAGLMIFPQNFLFSMGLSGVLVAGLAAAAALIVLPAVLALLGTRINRGAPKRWREQTAEADRLTEKGFWYRLSRGVQKRPAIVATVTALALILVALPAFRTNYGSVDASVLPTSASARQVADTIDADFPQDRSTPLYAAVAAPTDAAGQAEVTAYADQLAALPGAAGLAGPPQPLGDDTWRIDVLSSDAPLSDTSKTLLKDMRAVPTDLDVEIGGLTASFIDQQDSIAAHVPWAVLIIAVVTIVALFMMTGSVILPIKAVLMNILTLGATAGLVVLVFQDGRFTSILDYTPNGVIDLTMPILLGAIVFGLSTDYAVFLLSRIKESRDAGLPNDEAVAVGLQRTGRIVTAAALLFAVAIGAFVTGEIKLIKELGFGTAVAVLIDATIIRAFLVPSLMSLLGDWNWWAPGPLRRFHDRFGWKEEIPEEPDTPSRPSAGPPEQSAASA